MLEEQEEKAEGDYARMAELKSKELQLNDRAEQSAGKGRSTALHGESGPCYRAVDQNPGQPRSREQEFQRLSQLEVRLKSHIIGQDEAVSAVAAAVRRNRVGISPKHKPVSFIFVGPTGVGKTELVKQLADRPLQHAGCLDPAGYVGVYGEALRLPSGGLPSGLRGV